MAAAAAFYTKVMGWGTLDASMPGGPRYVLFTSGKAMVGGLMHQPDDARAAGAMPDWLGYVAVDNVDAAAERVIRLGGTVLAPPTDVPTVSRFSVFADPQGARLAVLKWAKPGQAIPSAAGEPGRVGWHELLAADSVKAFAFYGELFGWKKAAADEEAGTYQQFSAQGQKIGGMLTKPVGLARPAWVYYFGTADLEEAARRVTAHGGQIIDGPFAVPGGTAVVRCMDPQRALFALEGRVSRSAPGYFERTSSHDQSDPRGRRWSW
jgi:predicted enzyme related to lactoylglutathione lyase